MDAFGYISGVRPTQTALKSLRVGLFAHILGNMSREEKRNRRCNIAAFEAHRTEILLMLEDSDNWPVVRMEFMRGTRKPADRTELFMRANDI
jgi:hypothetical protein